MVEEEKIEVLHNIKYGGWGLSEKAIELYRTRNGNFNPNELEILNRTDPILIQIYNELGNDFDDKYSKTKIKRIPKKYENYYYIDEYDGMEFINIDYIKYKLDNIYNKIKEILQSTNNNNIKINEIEEFISAFEM